MKKLLILVVIVLGTFTTKAQSIDTTSVSMFSINHVKEFSYRRQAWKKQKDYFGEIVLGDSNIRVIVNYEVFDYKIVSVSDFEEKEFSHRINFTTISDSSGEPVLFTLSIPKDTENTIITFYVTFNAQDMIALDVAQL